MKKSLLIAVYALCLISNHAFARDTTHHISVEDALNTAEYQDRLDPDIPFFFGASAYPEPLKSHGTYVTNKKTNAFNKSDAVACEWTFLSALLQLQQRAVAEGGNAIVDIESYYKKNTFISDTEYECHAGGIMAGVALRGRVVTLP